MNQQEQTQKEQTENRNTTSVDTAKDSTSIQPTTDQQLRETEQKLEERIEERMTGFEGSMIRLTRYGLAVTILTGIIFAGQLYEMVSGGTQTDKLVGYAKKQTESANKLAAAALGADIRLSDWMRMKHDDKNMWAIVKVENRGKTNADDLRIAIKLEFLNSRPERKLFPTAENATSMSLNILPPITENGDFAIYTKQVSRSDEKLGDGLYVYGRIFYKSFDIEKSLLFCKSAPVKSILKAKSGDTSGYGDNCNGCTDPYTDCL